MATVSDPQGMPRTAGERVRLSDAGRVDPGEPGTAGPGGIRHDHPRAELCQRQHRRRRASDLPIVLGLAIAFGGFAQLLAGMWEFRTGNTFGAVAFSSFGAFWISFFFLVSFNVSQLPATEVNAALGLYLWLWGIFTGVLFLCTFASPRALQLLFLLLTITFILLGIGNAGAHEHRSMPAATSVSRRRRSRCTSPRRTSCRRVYGRSCCRSASRHHGRSARRSPRK